MPKRKHPFTVEIEARLTVDAFDADSARKKVERLLGGRGRIGEDVYADGVVWVYHVDRAEELEEAS